MDLLKEYCEQVMKFETPFDKLPPIFKEVISGTFGFKKWSMERQIRLIQSRFRGPERKTPDPAQQGPSDCMDSSNEYAAPGKTRYSDYVVGMDFGVGADSVGMKSFLGANPINDGFFFRIYFRDIGDFWMCDGL